MPHKKSAANKIRLNTLKKGKQQMKCLFGKTLLLHRELRNKIPNFHCVFVSNNLLNKRYWVDSDCSSDEILKQKVDRIEIYVFVMPSFKQYAFKIDYYDLTNMYGPSVQDLWHSHENREEYLVVKSIINQWIVCTLQQVKCSNFTNRIKEELAAAVWHPRRVARLIDMGGWGIIDL